MMRKRADDRRLIATIFMTDKLFVIYQVKISVAVCVLYDLMAEKVHP